MRTFEEIQYLDRSEMTKEEFEMYMEKIYNRCEANMSKYFWASEESLFEADKDYIGKEFQSVTRKVLDVEEFEPIWSITFADGHLMCAYSNEIILCDMKDNGCPEEYLVQR